MSPHTWSRTGGASAEIDAIANWARGTGLRNLTISGGEPMDQAPSISALVDELQRRGDWTISCYSGYELSDLRADRPAGSRAVLERIDLLIDGPYVRAQHEPLRWRGSANQRLRQLTSRVVVEDNDPSGLELSFDANGAVSIVGVPEHPSFVAELDRSLARSAATFAVGGRTAFPFPVQEVV